MTCPHISSRWELGSYPNRHRHYPLTTLLGERTDERLLTSLHILLAMPNFIVLPTTNPSILGIQSLVIGFWIWTPIGSHHLRRSHASLLNVLEVDSIAKYCFLQRPHEPDTSNSKLVTRISVFVWSEDVNSSVGLVHVTCIVLGFLFSADYLLRLFEQLVQSADIALMSHLDRCG